MVLRGTGSLASDAEDPGYTPGFWYNCHGTSASAGAILAANQLRLIPFRIRQLVNIQQIGARITTLAAGGFIQLGIYGANRDTLLPSGPVRARTASLPTDTAVNVAGTLFDAAGVAVPAVQFPRGIYWFAVMPDATAAGVVIMQAVSAGSTEFGNLVGAAAQGSISASASGAVFSRFVTGIATFGAWPDLTGVATSEAAVLSAAAGQFLVA